MDLFNMTANLLGSMPKRAVVNLWRIQKGIYIIGKMSFENVNI